VERLVASGQIKDWKAREILSDLQGAPTARAGGVAAGKVILLGEHGVVYGRRALALPIPDAVRVSVAPSAMPRHELPEEFVKLLLEELDVSDRSWHIQVESDLPIGKGLGSSAAIAVAIVRAFDKLLDLGLDDARVNEVAFESEKLAHGTPSGVDNTLATYATPMLFRNEDGLEFDAIEPGEVPPIVIAWGAETGRTSEQVAGVRARREQAREHFDALFDEMDRLSRKGARYLEAGNWPALGALMNLCHGLLNAIGVSTPQLERMVSVARLAGAAGAKLTGAGGGGSIVALCPGTVAEVCLALQRAGYSTIVPGDAE
jgi:hydroxymethylglutaryl-CoA reductase